MRHAHLAGCDESYGRREVFEDVKVDEMKLVNASSFHPEENARGHEEPLMEVLRILGDGDTNLVVLVASLFLVFLVLLQVCRQVSSPRFLCR